MNDRHKVTSEVALAVIDSMIERHWRTLNQARCCRQQHQHRRRRRRELLPARMQRGRQLGHFGALSFFYHSKEDAFTSSYLLRDVVHSLFVNPIPI
ncbi:hypothetical protein GUJ93_ZPchr0023g33376 [Zizania palustris]|uniref:Uncharacterized protein n=1 Tax=Zizania palustris TaxID=103762 RepID=A0A8J5QYY3_ZIZPA|nr:hypothetical protein GUJ93_ZPchr0023g33376 [Zizania palustris]